MDEETPAEETLAALVSLYRRHPRWAVWLPPPGGQWTAVRAAGPGQPSPDMSMLWVRAITSHDLADRMRRLDAALEGAPDCA